MAKEEIISQGKRYVTAKIASRSVDIVPDYITKLCRLGAVDARREDGVWYVNEESLAQYLIVSRLQTDAQRRAYAEELKEEYRDNNEAAQNAYSDEPTILFEETIQTTHRTHSLRVLVTASVTFFVCALMFAGALSTSLPVSQQLAAAAMSFSPIEAVAFKTYSFLCPFFGACSAASEKETQLVTLPKPAAPVTSNTSTQQPIAQQPTAAPSQQPVYQTVVTNPIIERIIEREVPAVAPLQIDSSFEGRLASLREELLSSIRSNASTITTVYQTLGAVSKIENLENVNHTNSRWTGGTISNATISGGTISGLSFSATDLSGVVGIAKGGTGTSTTPTYGQLLLGNATGGFDYVATSSLGISGVSTFLGLSDTPNSLTIGDLLYADAADNLAALPIGVNGQVLKIVGGVPAWSSDLQGSGGAGLFATTSDSLALYPADTTDILLLGNNATTTTGNILEVSGNALFRNIVTAYNTVTASRFVATSTTASVFPYASTTALSATSLCLSTDCRTSWPTGDGDFATTSADFWKTQRDFFSTTSVAYYNSVTDLFSTTSAQYFLGQNREFAFATTSANYFLTQNRETAFATSSANYFLGQNRENAFATTSANYFLASSSTIPKTYTQNVFSGLQTFVNASTTLITASYASTTNLIAGNFTLGLFNGPLQANNGVVSATTSIGAIYGGTGQTSYAVGDILYADSPTSLTRLSAGTNGHVLKLSGGVPTWAPDSTSGGGGAGAFSTTSNSLAIYPSDTSDVVIIGSSATATQSSIFEVIGQSYFSTNLGIGTTTPSTRLSVQGNGLFAGNVTAGNVTATGTVSTVNLTTGNVTATGTVTTVNLSIGSLNGPLQANGGVVSATTSIGVNYGGTGLTSAPSYGNLLVGNTSGGYTFMATSSLGLPTQSDLANYFTLAAWYATTTDGLDEGSTNQYFSNARVQTYLDGVNKEFFFATSSANFFLGQNREFAFATTSATYFLGQNREYAFATTSAQFFLTANRELAFATSSANYFISSSTTVPKTYTANTFTGAQSFTGTVTIGSLNGPLQANGGAISATTSVGVRYGGTGLSSAPTYGQVLLGNSSGGYDLVATSSLGISGGSSGSLFGQTLEIVNGSYLAPTTTLGVIVSASSTIANLSMTNATTTNATTTNFAITSIPNALLFTNSAGSVRATTSISSNYLDTAGNWSGTFDGQEGSYYLTNAFATTSADYYLALNREYAFATTSANYFVSSSTTIPKTYTANAFTALQSFNLASSTAFSSLDGLFVGRTSTTTILGSATSTFGAGIQTTSLNVTSSIASSTFANGINLSNGCFAINGSCVGTLSGSTGQIAYFTGTNTAVGTSSLFIATPGNVGVGTSTPNTKLTISASSANGLNLDTDTSASTRSSRLFFSNGTTGQSIGMWNESGAFTLSSSATPGSSSGNRLLTIDSSGNVGIGTTSPGRRLSITDAVSTAQQSIAYDGTRYTNLLTDSVGDFSINPQGDDVFLNDDNLWVCTGGSCPIGTPSGNGNLVVENKFGIGTSTPAWKLDVYDSSAPVVQLSEGDVAGSNAFIGLDAGNLFVRRGAIGNTDAFTVTSAGNIGVSTTTPGRSSLFGVHGQVYVGTASGMGTATSTFQGDIKITGKLDVSTIDPPYTIDGVKYATYVPSMTGVKEETTMKVQLEEFDSTRGLYAKKITFDGAEKGSDLWLFYQITAFGDAWENLIVSLTPAFDGRVFYEENPADNSLTLYADKKGAVSVRLIADRYDTAKWPNIRPDQDGNTEGTHVLSSKKSTNPPESQTAAAKESLDQPQQGIVGKIIEQAQRIFESAR